MTDRPLASITVAVDDRQTDYGVASDDLAQLLRLCLGDQGILWPAEVGLSFVDSNEMQELNRQHMGGTGPTDVLAFPIDGTSSAPSDQPALVGDIVICPAIAAKAPQQLGAELALLVVHGALHLLGHDHREQAETAEMKKLEQHLLSSFATGYQSESASEPGGLRSGGTPR